MFILFFAESMSGKTNKDLFDFYLDKVMDTVVPMDTMDYGPHDHHGHHEFRPGQYPLRSASLRGRSTISMASNNELLTKS